MHTVIPFVIPQYNWADLQTAYKLFKKTPPTREIERSGIQLTQPSAFITAFPEDWTPAHITLSFLFIIPSMTVTEIEEYLFIITFHRLIQGEMGGDLLLGTGTLFNWRIALDLLNKRVGVCYNNTYINIHDELSAYIRKYGA